MRVAIFSSGTGTNFEAIADNKDLKKAGLVISCVITDNPLAKVIEKSKARGIETIVIDKSEYKTKKEYEETIYEYLKQLNVEYIILAGYMRIVGDTLLNKYPQRIINIHPAMLPSFPGAHGIRDAFDAKVKQTGVTVHFIDSGIDTGPIIDQVAVPILPTDTIEDLEERIHIQEHLLYPHVLNQLINKMRSNNL
ncbi:phosphoribosylglycinamide formyltransferase [Companilactobacillus sp. RD055328]|uniref:phosphoribosylglycinamide formyltransferase n=1 Tax=Companilactobacillus sp. RD055328 TaxID=2916634 RepID=UPI001FC84E83|nr:phosphoribosylglycinamide formyltransferase [Companilactobacillus sp. RD055328]GKQ42596.1 phosphoribosylglycinamide formyltransferase [Companilactobacillus sp. RD055328]